MTPYDILVRGDGAVGLAMALALSRQGLNVAMLGASAEPVALSAQSSEAPATAVRRADVRAYALNSASVRLLTSLKVWDAIPQDAKTAVHDMHVEGDAPGAALDFSAWSQGLAELAWIVDAAELEAALRAAARFAPHVVAVAAEVPATLQVLVEGKQSATRERLHIQTLRHDYGQTAIAARLLTAQPHANLARQWFRSPDVLALLPLDRPEAGRGLALVWSLPTARAAELQALSDADFTAALMDATAGDAGPLKLAGPRAAWPLSLARAALLHGPGWVLAGDAAHVVHPLAGQGLNLGLADVAALADVLAARESWRRLDDPRLLARYARRRLGATLAMARVTDGLLQLFASQQPVLKELRNRGLTLVNRLSPLKRLLTGRALGG